MKSIYYELTRSHLAGISAFLLACASITAGQSIPRATGIPAGIPAEMRTKRAQQVRKLNNEVLGFHARFQETGADGIAGLRAYAAETLRTRAAEMSALIQQDPAQALSFAFSPELANDLAAKFPESAATLEKHGTWEGPAQIWIEDFPDGSHKSYVQLTSGQETLRAYFAEGLPNLKCGDSLRVSGVQLGAMLAAMPLSAEVIPSVTAQSTTSSTACGTTGVQNTAVLIVTFPGVALPSNITPSNVYGMFFGTTGQSFDSYLRETSYGQTSAAGNVFGPYTLDSTYNDCMRLDLLRDAAVTAAASAGVNFQNYNRIFVITPNMCGWTGMSLGGCTSLSSPTGAFTASTSFLNASWQRSQGEGAQNASHEGGHNFGLAHAQFRDFGAAALGPLGTTGTVAEYGDDFSVMGADGYPYNFGHYPAPQKAEVLNWLSSGTDYQVVQSSGTWTLSPLETSQAGLKALKVQRGIGNNAWLWLEYRQHLGNYDSNLCAATCQPYLGALIHYEDSTTGTYTQLLDFTPATDSWDDPALLPGLTWSDPYTNLSIAIVSATANGLTVNVSYGATSCTHANPTVSLSPSNPSVAAGSSVSYGVSITNNDSTACPAGAFNLSSDQPATWPGSFSANSVTLNPGQQGVITMMKNVPAGTTPGVYGVDTIAVSALSSATGTGTANSTVIAPSTLSLSLSVAGSIYSRGQAVSMTATVLNGATPVANASVTFTMIKADGTKTNKTVRTDSTGKAVWIYKVSPKDPQGYYSVTAQANYNSNIASGSASFSVQ
jgi:hypothetical protein